MGATVMLSAGMDTHRIEIFDGADDDTVVGLVAHDFHLVFLPAEEGFFDEDFVHGRKFDAVLGDGFKLFLIVTDAAARAAERERRADDEWKLADLLRDVAGFVEIVRDAGDGNVEADFQHQFLERKTIFAAMDGVGLGTDHFDVVPFERAVFVEGHRGVQRSLAAECGEQNEFALRTETFHFRFFTHDNFLHTFGRDGFDVGAVGELRVGHDGGRVGVDKDDAVAFLAQGLARLSAGVIELARLADDDRAGADDEDAVDVGALGHKSKRQDETRIGGGAKVKSRTKQSADCRLPPDKSL